MPSNPLDGWHQARDQSRVEVLVAGRVIAPMRIGLRPLRTRRPGPSAILVAQEQARQPTREPDRNLAQCQPSA